jgi:hypothetical protein
MMMHGPANFRPKPDVNISRAALIVDGKIILKLPLKITVVGVFPGLS